MSCLTELHRRLRAMAFFLLITVASLLVLAIDIIIFPYVYFADPKRFLYHQINALLARVCMWPFFSVDLQGLENISNAQATVIAANHQSALDAFILALLGHVNFKCTFKRAIAFYPGLGQAFVMAKHIIVVRGDRNSAKRVIEKCKEFLRNGVSILFFPEGTRKVVGQLGDFKTGAFRVACDTGVPVTPVTIKGARSLLKPRGFPSLGWGKPSLTVHPPIPTKGRTFQDVMAEVRAVIEADIKDEPVLTAAGHLEAVDSSKKQK